MPPKKAGKKAKGSTRRFNWDDGQEGKYLHELIAKGILKYSCTRDQYRAMYDGAPSGVLDFQTFSQSWANVKRNLDLENAANQTIGGRKEAMAASAGMTSPAPTAGAASASKSALRSTSKKQQKGRLPIASSTGLAWETLHSYWTDKEKHRRLHFFVVVPSGTRPCDIQLSVAKNGMRVDTTHTWPECLFDPTRVFEGQTKTCGAAVAGAGSTKNAELDKTTEKLKPSSKSTVTTEMVIHLEKKVEPNLVGWDGKPTKALSFFKAVDEEWPQYPILYLVFGLMVRRAVDDGYVEKEEEDQVYE